jgi:hypothetical protein
MRHVCCVLLLATLGCSACGGAAGDSDTDAEIDLGYVSACPTGDWFMSMLPGRAADSVLVNDVMNWYCF